LGAGAYVNGSDERLKDEIEPLSDGVNIVKKLNPVTFKYKEFWVKDNSRQPGFVAQEVRTALEGTSYIGGIVSEGSEYLSLAYQNFTPLLVRAIQELLIEVEQLNQRVIALEPREN